MGGGQRGCSPDPIPQEERLFSLPHSLCPPPNHSLSGRKASMHPGVILKWVGRGMWCGWESESSLKMYVGPWAGGQEAAGSDRERLDPDQWHVGLRSWGRGLRASEDPGYGSSSGSSCNWKGCAGRRTRSRLHFCFCLWNCLALLHSMWDLSSLIRDRTCTPCNGSVES